MFKLTVLAVGKIKDRNVSALCAEYCKRLARYARIEVAEVRDVRDADADRARAREAEALAKKLGTSATVVALTREGRGMSSTDLASWLEAQANAGRSRVTFCIGGPSGLAPSLLKRARLQLSLSQMTFTHEMARAILLEQLYRAMTIRQGEPYHRGS